MALNHYLKKINKHRLLSREEEARLASRIRSGDTKSLKTLVKANLKFVVSIAARYRYQNVRFEDLIGYGNKGIIIAAKNFDERMGWKFVTYASWWIRQAILHGMAKESRLLKMSYKKTEKMVQISNLYKKFFWEFGRAPDVEEISRELKLEDSDVCCLLNNMTYYSLDSPCEGIESLDIMDVYVDQNQVGADNRLCENDRRLQINKLLKRLDDRSRKIVSLYYGLERNKKMTLPKIGKKLGITTERVRQIKSKSLKKLKMERLRDLL